MRIERSRRDDARKHSGSSSAVGAFAKGVADGFFTQKKIGHDFLYEIAKSLEYDKVALEKQYTF
jgi:hypothetical protein